MPARNSRIESGGRGKTRPSRHLAALGVLAAAVLGVLGWGGYALFARLADVCAEQTRVTDAETQIHIETGKIIPRQLVINHFGLTNGVRLADVDFAERRARFLADTPNARTLDVTLRRPNVAQIQIRERVPLARLAAPHATGPITSCVDADGVVFYYPARETALLPIIRMDAKRIPRHGARVEGLAVAAIQLAEAASGSDFEQLKIQDVDATGRDWLVATMGDASRAKIAWEDMHGSGRGARASESLHRQLKRLRDAIRSNVSGGGVCIWNATDFGTPGRIYATPQQLP